SCGARTARGASLPPPAVVASCPRSLLALRVMQHACHDERDKTSGYFGLLPARGEALSTTGKNHGRQFGKAPPAAPPEGIRRSRTQTRAIAGSNTTYCKALLPPPGLRPSTPIARRTTPSTASSQPI